jgi:predicted nucleic acid-binding protein
MSLSDEIAKINTIFIDTAPIITLVEISADIAEIAGKLRGQYPFLRTMDAIQIGVAIEIGADAFFTNDAKLGQIKEIRTLILRDYL